MADFMLGQLRGLQHDTRDALTLAACMGARFGLRPLALACGLTLAQLLQALRPALVAGLVLPLDARYPWHRPFSSHGCIVVSLCVVVRLCSCLHCHL